MADRRFADIVELLAPGDVLVVNDTRVIKARLHGRKDSGGEVEVLVERVLDQHRVLAQVRASKPRKPVARWGWAPASRPRCWGGGAGSTSFRSPRAVSAC